MLERQKKHGRGYQERVAEKDNETWCCKSGEKDRGDIEWQGKKQDDKTIGAEWNDIRTEKRKEGGGKGKKTKKKSIIRHKAERRTRAADIVENGVWGTRTGDRAGQNLIKKRSGAEANTN